MLNLIFLGPPGAGKGTVAQSVSDKFGLVQVSTGDLIRDEIALGSELGKKLGLIINSGGLVDDDLMVAMLEKKLNELIVNSNFNGFILDGFPRTLGQANLLNDLLSRLNLVLSAVIFIESSEENIVARLSARWTCPKCKHVFNSLSAPPLKTGFCDFDNSVLFQRDDDKSETIRVRLKTFFEKTSPLIDFYSKIGLLKKYDGNVPPRESILRAEQIIVELLNNKK